MASGYKPKWIQKVLGTALTAHENVLSIMRRGATPRFSTPRGQEEPRRWLAR